MEKGIGKEKSYDFYYHYKLKFYYFKIKMQINKKKIKKLINNF